MQVCCKTSKMMEELSFVEKLKLGVKFKINAKRQISKSIVII